MRPLETSEQLPASDVEAAAWIFEQLALESGQAVNRPRIRRALDEATTAWPGAVDDLWWKWMVEASTSLQLKSKVIDCTLDQFAEIAREGGRIVAHSSAEHPWLAVVAARGRKFRVLRPMCDQTQAWMSKGSLRTAVGSPSRQRVFRCVVIESALDDVLVTSLEPVPRTPFARLLGLLRPESSDIWIVLVFALVVGVLAMATPLAVETLVNTVAFGRLLQPVIVLALMLLAFLSFSAALRAVQTFVVEIIQRRLFARVAADLAYRLPRVQTEALDGHSGRELVNRFFDVVTVQKISAQLLLDALTLVISVLIGMAVLAFYHPWLLGFDVVLLASMAFAVFVLGRGAVDSSTEESKSKYRMAAWLEDLAGNPTMFRYDGAAEFALDRADRLTYEYLSARKKHFRILMRQIIFALGMQAVASTVLLGLGGWLVVSGQLTLGQLVAAELIVAIIVGSFAKTGKHLEGFYDLLASVDKLGQLFDLPVERQDGLLRAREDAPADVTLHAVSYSFPGGRNVIDSLDLRVDAGERCVVSGPSGSGKSVLFDLLFGLRSPTFGHITISGVDPRDLRPDVLRRHVALVRDIELFGGTVAENVHLERPDVSTGDVREALEEVGLLDVVLKLPEGLDTPLSPSGDPLTRNQTRLLMLARGIVGRPRLLLIDGLLDALPDVEAEGLAEEICRPDQPWTLMMVTGRESISAKATQWMEFGPPKRGGESLAKDPS